MTTTAVGAPAQWQDIFDTLDAMTPDELRVLAAYLYGLWHGRPAQ